MKSIYWLEFGIYIDSEIDFRPFDIYKIIKIKPTFCKMHHKNLVELLNKNWRQELKEYEESHLIENDKIIEDLMPLGFYKITSSIFYRKDFRNSILSFVQRISKKQKQLRQLEKSYQCIFRLKIVGRNCNEIDFLIPKEMLELCLRNNAMIQLECKT